MASQRPSATFWFRFLRLPATARVDSSADGYAATGSPLAFGGLPVSFYMVHGFGLIEIIEDPAPTAS